jgi:predicted 2-oxoglutarate/Fe(II)-dependent dioxygenase YbiX
LVPDAGFFAKFGIFCVKNFLDDDACRDVRTAVSAATATPSVVSQAGDANVIDQTVRRTLRAHVPENTTAAIRTRVEHLKPALEAHFAQTLGDCQPPQFLIYRPGDFFSVHADAGDEADEPDFIQRRAVSVVIFLSTEASSPGPSQHQGGSLVLYGLFADQRAKDRGLPLTAEQGLLVAFRANQLHRVNTVTAGERLSIVCWFERPQL